MTGGIEVDVAALRSAAQTIGGGGERLGAQVQQLQVTFNGAGNPWGGDEPGTVFGMAYVEVVQHALDVYASMAEQLLDVADGLATSADNHELTDSDNAALFTRMELPGGPATAV